MSELRASAERLVLQKAVLDLLADANAELRDVVREELAPGDRIAAHDGYVQMTNPTERWAVIDWDALTRFALEHLPDDAFVRTLAPWVAKSACRTGRMRVERTDPETGEVTEVDVDVPGVARVSGRPDLRVVGSDAATALAARLLRTALPEVES